LVVVLYVPRFKAFDIFQLFYHSNDAVQKIIGCQTHLIECCRINFRAYLRDNKNGQSRETANIGYTRRRKTKQKHNTILCWTPIYVCKHR